jgi:protoporphyrinogen oxidase
VYDRLWKPLFDYKFYRYADDISAAWIWTRIKRIGRSRKSLFSEELGYIEGGSQTLVDALCEAIRVAGGKVRVSCVAQEVMAAAGKVCGVRTSQGVLPADAVICTVPTPIVSRLVPGLPEAWKARYDSIANIGVCCLVFKLRRSISPHFWVNVAQAGMEIPGFVEFSNLRPIGDTIVYVPYYMPVDHPKFGWPDNALLEEAFDYLQRVNTSLAPEDIIASYVARLRFAQPVCTAGFAATIPPINTPIGGLQIADTCFYYPEDRGISESVRFGKMMANRC